MWAKGWALTDYNVVKHLPWSLAHFVVGTQFQWKCSTILGTTARYFGMILSGRLFNLLLLRTFSLCLLSFKLYLTTSDKQNGRNIFLSLQWLPKLLLLYLMQAWNELSFICVSWSPGQRRIWPPLKHRQHFSQISCMSLTLSTFPSVCQPQSCPTCSWPAIKM